MAQTWRELRRCDRQVEAEALRVRLLEAGIAAHVPDPRVMGQQPTCRAGPATSRVLVAAEDYDRARALLGFA